MSVAKVNDLEKSIVKPEELVDIIEMTPLTLQDRRNYNLLLAKAWNNIKKGASYEISSEELTRHVDSKNQDVAASLRRLMASLVVANVPSNKNGIPEARQVHLLGTTIIEKGGRITFHFSDDLVKIINNTQVFARIHTKVMFQLSSKYSLALYEMIQKRRNLRYKDEEIFPVEKLRKYLGVENGKLTTFGNFNSRVLKPAIKDVTLLSGVNVEAELIKTGRSTTHVKLKWYPKVTVGEKIAAVEELNRPKTGRAARINNTIENVTPSSAISDEPKITDKGYEGARGVNVERFDIQFLQREWIKFWYESGKPEIIDPDKAFIGFVKTYKS